MRNGRDAARRPLRASAPALALALALPAATTCERAPAPRVRPVPADAAVAPAPAAPRPAEPPPLPAAAPPPAWPFIEHAAARCLPDQLARTDYLLGWLGAWRRAGRPPISREDPSPAPDRVLPPARPRGAAERAAVRRAIDAWRAEPLRGHVMDCTVDVAVLGTRGARAEVPYTVFLPADYLARPARPRPVLVLFTGGHGSRTRWFLNAADAASPRAWGAGVRARVDAWSRARPRAAPPVVVAIEPAGGAYPNGAERFLHRELPAHVLATYLPAQPRARTALGVAAVSSGGAVAMRVLARDPDALQSVALLAMFCWETGFLPSRDAGATPAARAAFYDALAARARSGRFDAAFAIGARDSFWRCNRALHRALARAGAFPPRDRPALARCAPGAPPSVHACEARWPGFASYPGVGHRYALLADALGPALDAQLDALDRITAALAR